MRDEVLEKVVANAEVEVSDILVERRIDAHMNRLSERLKSQGYTLEQYYEVAETSEEEIRTKYREQAVESVKTDLVLEEIAGIEKIEVKDEEIIEEIQQLAQEYNENIEVLQRNLQNRDSIEALSYGIMIDKTIKFLMDNSKELGSEEKSSEEEGSEEKDAPETI